MKSYTCKYVRKQEVTLYIEAPSATQAEETAKEFAQEFLNIDDALEDDLKEDLNGGTVKITSAGCNAEVTKYAVSEACDVEA
jgi:hypothetical protein